MSTTTARIAEWIVQTEYSELPRRVVEEAKNQVLSVVAAVHAGHFSEAGRAVTRAVKEWGVGKDATLIPSGERATLHHAILANTALSMALDYDDYLFGGHTGHSAVLVSLALAEKVGVSGQELLVAQTLANEVAGRVGASVETGALDASRRSVVHQVGAAVSAAKLLDVDEAAAGAAVALALTQPPRPLKAGWPSGDARVVLAALTAPAGVQAAQLAASGLRGAAEVLDGPEGFSQVFGSPALPGAYDGWGKVWLTDTLSYKAYPGSALLGTTIDCVLALARQHNLDPKRVRAVHVAAGPATVEADAAVAPYLNGPDTPPAALSGSVAYNVAVALMDRDLTARQVSRDRMRDPALWDLTRRVHLTMDPAIGQRTADRSLVKCAPGETAELNLANLDLNGFRVSCGARVRIELEDGRSFEAEQEVPYGAAGRPFDERRRSVEDKFRRETRYTLRKEKMERAVDMILHLEQMNAANLRELVRLCCSERV
jgi:2-methylcitrate dehydratase PrpD